MSEPGDSEPRQSLPLSSGQTVAGKYLVQELLGRGGMGVVYAARDLRIERRVALKVLLPRLVPSPTASGRFMQEARASTRITSEHVVKLLDTFTLPDNTPLLVLEYLEGRDLRAVLVEDGPLLPQQAVDYLLQALQAVAEGHMQSIIHRDLKPSNLFLSERADGTPLIKVLDFGIAKILESGSTDDLSLTGSEDIQLGSPIYMPPEQFSNPRDVDARADIWALGVTLYELISGKQPFQGASYQELVARVLAAAPEPLTVRPGTLLPAGLEPIIRKCLEKERSARYLNAVELAVALAPFGSDDARLSLTRVSGLARPRSPNPATPREVNAYEATLPVAVDPLLRPHSYTSNEVRAAPRGRLWAALGVGVAISGLGWLLWSQQRVPSAGTASAAPALATDLSALRALPSAPVVLPSGPLEIPSSAAPPQATDSATTPRPIASNASQHAAEKTSRAAPRAAKRVIDAEHTANNDNPAEVPSTTEPSARVPAAATREAAPDELIESLIEHRH